ncbi:hypothetical protein Goarm_022182 [Gossypium armourianum]|uniref:Uncharacterized protein n=1 Tax=Gossypium armourianum TaxID=34283 RepID=A0A7J9KFV4_9ROSI|nr:hypothetical protein [Gossypium armourianum]
MEEIVEAIDSAFMHTAHDEHLASCNEKMDPDCGVMGFSRGVWILWKDTILVDIMALHPQVVTMRVRDNLG